MRLFFLWILLFHFTLINAQNKTFISFVPKFKSEQLLLNKMYYFEKDTVIITNFKFYISNLQYFKNDSLVYTSNKSVHLIDLSINQSLTIIEKGEIDFDKITFNVGIDSFTSVSGVLDGDLDPVYGMYWTWQSGYINFKLEGFASNISARQNKFYWHIGGYLEPFYSMRKISLSFENNNPLEIHIQLDELFNRIDVSKIYQVMSPSEKSIQIANELPKIFKIPAQ
jgi:hypothetical protein